MLITSFSIFIWWICTFLATGDVTLSSLLSVVEVMRMKAPLDGCPGTVARTHASSTVVWAETCRLMPSNDNIRYLTGFIVWLSKRR